VFENRVLRRVFGPKRDEATGEFRQLHNQDRYNLYSSPNVIRQIKSKENEVSGECGTHGGLEKSVLARRKEGTRKTKAQKGSEWILGRLAGGV
jgi:hypothetical protein